MCDNSLLTIIVTLHIDDPTKVRLPKYKHACKAFIEYFFRSHCSRLNQLTYSTQFQLSHCGTPFFDCYFIREDSVSQRLFFNWVLSHKSHTMSQFNSWVAGARVSFLPKETQQQPGTFPVQRC